MRQRHGLQAGLAIHGGCRRTTQATWADSTAISAAPGVVEGLRLFLPIPPWPPSRRRRPGAARRGAGFPGQRPGRRLAEQLRLLRTLAPAPRGIQAQQAQVAAWRSGRWFKPSASSSPATLSKVGWRACRAGRRCGCCARRCWSAPGHRAQWGLSRAQLRQVFGRASGMGLRVGAFALVTRQAHPQPMR